MYIGVIFAPVLCREVSKMTGAADANKGHPHQPAKSGRLAMQDWCSFPLYINKKTWTSVLEAPGSLVALDVVLRHLVQLGLRSPSEQTQAMLAALCVLRDLRDDSSSSKQIPDAMKLRSIFLNVKARVHTSMFKAKQDGDQMLPHGHLVALPANPKDAPAGLLSLAFPDGYESESDSAPFSLMDLANVAREISLRSTNSKVVNNKGPQLHSPEAFWASTQSAWMMMMQQWGKPPSEECRLTMTRQPGKALGALLDRAEGKGTTQQPQLALPAPPLPASKDVLPEKPPASADPPLPCPALCDRPSSQPLESVPTSEALPSKPSCAPEGLPTSQVQDEKVNDMAPHNRGISLAESVEKMKEARVKLKEGSNQSHGPVMKKPAKGPSNPKSKSLGSLASKCATQPPKKPKQGFGQGVMKRPSIAKAASNHKAKNDERKRLREEIIAKLDVPTRKKFKDGCAKCRWRKLCTLSCWQYRGY